MGWDQLDKSRCGKVLCVTKDSKMRSQGPRVWCLSRLKSHTNLDWARRVCVDFGVGTTVSIIERRFANRRQSDQAGAERRGIRTWDSMSSGKARVRGTKHPYVRVSVTPGTSEVTFRLEGQFWPKR